MRKVLLELTGGDIRESLRCLSNAGITAFDVACRDDLTATLAVAGADLTAVEAIAARRGDSLKRISGEKGPLPGILGYPVVCVVFAMLLLVTAWISDTVLFIRVEGNQAIGERQILSAAEELGLGFGVSRREIQNSQIKNGLISRIPRLSWVGVNTAGCVAVITVREREETAELSGPPVSQVRAVRDGVITSAVVTSGVGMCQAGQTVAAGDLLIDGIQDRERVTTLCRAQGEIMAQTGREVTAVGPGIFLSRMEETKKTQKYSLIIGKKRINFYKGSGICGATCDKMYTEYCLTLPGGWHLPVKLIQETCTQYRCAPSVRSRSDAEKQLEAFARRYLCGDMVGGSIQKAVTQLAWNGDHWLLEGVFSCTEMIGREQGIEIGDLP